MVRAGKGSKFERDECRTLSKWWSNNRHDDLYWRTSQSGGRSTTRGKKGKRTRGHEGDITATGRYGSTLTKLITFEMKRGYNKVNVDHLLDRPDNAKPQVIEEWLHQAVRAAKRAGTRFWAIIHKKDRRESCIYFPHDLYRELCVLGCFDRLPMPCLSVTAWCRAKGEKAIRVPLICMRLDRFLGFVDPADVKRVYEGRKKR